jgi:hypothetical protein
VGGDVIPVTAIEEPIRTLLTKHAMARPKGIRMTSDQDKAELQQILTWFEDWHEQYGAQKRFFRGLDKQLAEGKQIIPDGVIEELPMGDNK